MSPLASIVDVGRLAQVAATALLAGVGVTALFAFAVLGAVRTGDCRRAGRAWALRAYAALSALCIGGCLAAAVYGVALTAQK